MPFSIPMDGRRIFFLFYAAFDRSWNDTLSYGREGLGARKWLWQEGKDGSSKSFATWVVVTYT